MTRQTPQNAIILLAGMGTRLRPLTESTHKALITIGTKTILERQVSQLYDQNIKNIHLVLGYRSCDIKNYVNENLKDKGTFFFYDNFDFEINNTAYSLMLALKNISESFILLDGDVLLDDYLMSELCNETKKNLLLSDTDQSKLNKEAVKFRINDKNEIIEIGKPIKLNLSAGESIGVGLYQKDWTLMLKPFLELAMKDKSKWQWYYEDAIQVLIKEKKGPSPLFILPTDKYPWVEIDDHADLKMAQKLFL